MHFGLSSIHWKGKFMINAFQVEDFQTLHSVCLYPLCLRSDSVPSLTCVLFLQWLRLQNTFALTLLSRPSTYIKEDVYNSE